MPDQTNTTPIALSPPTYERHAAAVEYVEQSIRTRDPLWGTGRFPGIIPGRWAILANGDSISAVSGTSLGTGTVKLCGSNGVLDDPEMEIEVKNTGDAITASSGDMILQITWTAGDWCVTCPGASA